ncbi:sulfotransferase family 2 domain-containing protein [Microbulbifer sp. ZKSA002]|uniref:sulfotransferase family 2 domain-containing protein n=1 Tax=Microbulbifer sp. ZKSA002 TaxID=3243388 RepID=UPI00403A65FC
MPIYFKGDKELLFIHIPKCGGSTIEKHLLEVASGGHLFNPRKGDLPCCPQHFHAPLLRVSLKRPKNMTSFAVVRHPLMRAVSEYFWQNRKCISEGKELPEPNKAICGFFDKYKRNSYACDNHIRPQVEFLLEKTKVFYLEKGMSDVFKFAYKALNIYWDDSVGVEAKNKSKLQQLTLTRETIELVQSFYQMDFEAFGYTPVAINKDEIQLSELKKIVAENLDLDTLKYGENFVEECA